MEAVGQLTGGIAHDFNNLLAGISGSLELVKNRLPRRAAPPRCRAIWTRRTGAAKRAAALTQRLLAFSRRQTLDPKPIDVNRLIAGMEDLIRRTIGPGHRDARWSARPACGRPGRRLATGKRAAQSLHQRARRDAGRRPPHHRDRQQMAGRARGAQRANCRPANMFRLCVTDTGTGMTAGRDRARLRSRSSPPSRWARARAWACR